MVSCKLWFALKKIKLSIENTEDEGEEEIGTNILEGSVQNTTSGSSRKIKIDIRKILTNWGNQIMQRGSYFFRN